MNEEELSKYCEKKANQFNFYCLFIMGIISIIALILNEIGIFVLDKNSVRIPLLIVFGITMTPAIAYFIAHKVKACDPSLLSDSRLKWVIITISFLSITIIAIALSFQVCAVLVLPTLMAAQYKSEKKLTIISLCASMLLIVISVYGSFMFGIYDANLLKPLTEEQARVLENRMELLRTSRAFTILLHYVIPRMLCVAAVDLLALSITKRTRGMLDLQIELGKKVTEEMQNKSQMQNGVIEHLADIIESRDLETGEHIKRTKQYVSILVEKMRTMDLYKDILNPKMCENIINSAPLHDIGKIAVSDLILCKPGRLTDEEFEKMKIHTVKGGEIIKSILNDLGDKEFLDVAHDIAISHHEKWNGNGYPYGLKEENIPLAGRIMAIADVFDALVSERVYKKPMPISDAIEVIIKDAGSHFDPNIVEVFKEVKEKFILIASNKE